MNYGKLLQQLASRYQKGGASQGQQPGQGFGLSPGGFAPPGQQDSAPDWANSFRRAQESGDGFADYTNMRPPQAGGGPGPGQSADAAHAHWKLMQDNAERAAKEREQMQQTWMQSFMEQQQRRDNQMMQFFR